MGTRAVLATQDGGLHLTKGGVRFPRAQREGIEDCVTCAVGQRGLAGHSLRSVRMMGRRNQYSGDSAFSASMPQSASVRTDPAI